eukprot:6849486-Prymnesium_polylepis.1
MKAQTNTQKYNRKPYFPINTNGTLNTPNTIYAACPPPAVRAARSIYVRYYDPPRANRAARATRTCRTRRTALPEAPAAVAPLETRAPHPGARVCIYASPRVCPRRGATALPMGPANGASPQRSRP